MSSFFLKKGKSPSVAKSLPFFPNYIHYIMCFRGLKCKAANEFSNSLTEEQKHMGNLYLAITIKKFLK